MSSSSLTVTSVEDFVSNHPLTQWNLNYLLYDLLPEYFREIGEFEELADTEQIEFEKIYVRLWQVLLNCYVQVCDEQTLNYWENIFEIINVGSETEIFRRNRIMNRLNLRVPLTLALLKERINVLTGNPNSYEIEIDYSNYLFNLKLISLSKEIITEVLLLVNIMLPAHLVFNKFIVSYASALGIQYLAGATKMVRSYYTAQSVVVEYNSNYEQNEIKKKRVLFGSNYTIANNVLNREEYDLVSWNTAADGSGTSYLPGQVIINIQSDLVLYAIWQLNWEISVYTDGPAVSGENKFWGGVLAPNGNVICIPFTYPNIGIYDPIANTYTNGPAVSGTLKFSGGVLAPNGKVIMMPRTYRYIGIYDPVTNEFTNGPAVSGTDTFIGGVLASNGKVIMMPHTYPNIGIYDPIANTFTDGPAVSGANKFRGGVLAPNGKVIMVPFDYGYIGIYDPIANTFTNGPAVSGTSKFWGGVLAPNGKIIMVPFIYPNIGIYDPIANTFTNGPAMSIKNQLADGVLLPNGKVIMVPFDYRIIGIYDPATNEFTNKIEMEIFYSKFIGGVLVPNGNVIIIPYNYANIGVVLMN